MRYLTTITDARQLVSEWTESYTEQPTAEQVHAVARELVAFLGGFGADADPSPDYDPDPSPGATEFDLAGALARAGY